MIDFSEIDEVRSVVEECTRIPVHPRHPYVGELVHTAFSGTHQDAIRKGFHEHARRASENGTSEADAIWRIPYLPLDPQDLGRTYDAVIKVNAQSGKGGIAYILETEYGVEISRSEQSAFAEFVQRHADASGGVVTPQTLRELYDAWRSAAD